MHEAEVRPNATVDSTTRPKKALRAVRILLHLHLGVSAWMFSLYRGRVVFSSAVVSSWYCCHCCSAAMME